VAHDELAPLSGELDDISDPPIEVENGVSARVVWGLAVLLLVTVVALVVAWYWSENTELHFWLVAQFVPVFYAFWIWRYVQGTAK
jgi:hypothetical protein